MGRGVRLKGATATSLITDHIFIELLNPNRYLT